MAQVRHVCLYQDVPSNYVSIQLAVLSIGRFEPNWTVHVFLPTPTKKLLAWLHRQPNVRFHEASPAINGFNVKPKVLLSLIKQIEDEVIWVDSDILITRPIEPIIESVPVAHCIVTEDPPGEWPAGSRYRTEGWGLPIGRCFPKTINSCFLKFGKNHLPLLQAWSDAVDSKPYLAAQKIHWSKRPGYFLGDQDALNAIMGSDEFSYLDVHFLRNGIDIAQCHGANGYSWSQRLGSLFRGLPALVHAQGGQKPWDESRPLPTYLDVSPYKILAQFYSEKLFSSSWIKSKTTTGRVLRALSMGSPILSGFVPAISRAAWLSLRRTKNFLIGRRHLGH